MVEISNISEGGAETPSQAVINDANRVVYATDSRGRKFGIRKVGMSVKRRIFSTISAETAAKPQLSGMMFIVASVVEIDGEKVALPSSEAGFNARIDLLDDEGFEAIGAAYQAAFAPKDDTTAIEEAKNS